MYALEGTLDTIEIPEHEEQIYAIQELGSEQVPEATLRERIDAFLSKVPTTDEPSKALGADFRIDAVRTSWDTLFAAVGTRDFAVLRLRVACASGTYMRSLAGRIGRGLGTNALALSIHRTRIGRRRFGIWYKSLG